MSNRLEWLKSIVKQAGQISIDLHHTIEVEMKKDHRDLVTLADRQVEQFLTREILKKYPDHLILGEESETPVAAYEPNRYVWVIDPIDGTTNYIHGIGNYCISIALTQNGKGIMGAVYNPITGELFSAEKGGDISFTTETKGVLVPSVSERNTFETILFSTSMFWDDPKEKNTLHPKIVDLAKKTRGIRMHASAALDICLVACGKLDAYIIPALSPWDFAAAVTILEIVGGKATSLDGEALDLRYPSSVIASSGVLHDELINHFKCDHMSN